MNHYDIIKEYIEKYAGDKSAGEKQELYNILSNPDNNTSGDFFELYNKQKVEALLDRPSSVEITKYEDEIAKLFTLPYNKKIEDIVTIAKGLTTCAFANQQDIAYRLQFHSDEEDIIPEKLPLKLQCTSMSLVEKLFDPTSGEGEYILQHRIKYTALVSFFEKLTECLKRGNIDNSVLITLLKKDSIEDRIPETYNKLIQIFENGTYFPAPLISPTEMAVENIEKIRKAQKEKNQYVIDQEVKNFGPERMSFILDILHLEEQLIYQNDAIKGVFHITHENFDGLQLTDMIIAHFKQHFGESWAFAKSMMLKIQHDEIVLRTHLHGYTHI